MTTASCGAQGTPAAGAFSSGWPVGATRFWVPAAAAMAVGAWTGLRAPVWLPAAWLAWVLAALLVLAGRRRVSGAAALAWLALTMLLRAHLGLGPPQPPDLPMPRTPAPIQQLEVMDEPEWTPEGQRFTARWLLRCPAPPFSAAQCRSRQGLLRVHVRGRELAARQGQVVRVAAFVSPPPAYLNPGCADMTQAWERQGYVGSVHIGHAERLAVVERGGGPTRALQRLLGAARRWLGLRIQSALAPQEAAVVTAMTLGDRGAEWPELDAWLRETGTAHILAVSGSHLALVLAGLRWLLALAVVRWAPRLLRRASLSAWIALPLIAAAWLYVGLTGAAPATVRSAWMATAVVLAQVVAAKPSPWELLGLALVVALALEPEAVDDLGLQLSAAGVAGLLWSSDGEARRGLLTQAWRAALGAFVLTSAVSALRMGQVAWLSVPVNLLAVPYAAALLPASLLATLLAVLDWGAPQLAWVAVWPLRWAVEHTGGTWPVALLTPAEAALVALWLPLSLASLWHGRQFVTAAAGAGLLLAGLGAWQLRAGLGPDILLRLTFLDVGHGDSTLVQWPDGRAWLVDGGGGHGDGGRTGERAVVPALKALGVAELDVAVLTHAHPDHENGLVAVARVLPARSWWWNGQPGGGEEHAELLKRWASIRDPLLQPWAGQGRRVGPVQVRLLWPDGPRWPWSVGWSHNDNSLVVEMEAAGRRVLLSGDVEKDAEAALVRGGALRPAAVLKVPHHGSRTSSTPEFLAALGPRLAVVGARPWGQLPFPHPEVSERYRAAGIPLWSTSAGAVTVELRTDGWTARQRGRVMEVRGF